ncbi:acyclic terpene utilization AtuA family protein [Paraburkholderia sp. BCC1886]|uniref:acyclic terpene utilization AtuA family protein n=1 Tax=Paraburkholderia sp. BCC1886 TaxID=2562670 RepID=UPI001181CD92|nr:acyclic terpene utilization AtuA family protein [Paraburkholderia sp. BCC1886]
MEDELRIMAVAGNLGYGFPETSLKNGIARKPHLVGADNGSSDPGPYYLGSGKSLIKREQLRRDLGLSLKAARDAGVPYVIGTAGTAGGKPHLDEFLDVLDEVTKRDGLRYKLATIPAEIDKSVIKQAIREGRVKSMGVLPELTEEAVDETTRIVAQMGTDPFVNALDAGADVIIAGRACDTAIYASLAAARGFDMGLAFHMAKLLECGAQCSVPLAANDCLLGTLRRDHFELEPMNMERGVTPVSVAAHMMYEQPDPHHFYEPEGLVDLEHTHIEKLDDRRVRVSGSKLVEMPPSIKLEGVKLRGYRTITVAGMTDPRLLAAVDQVEARVRDDVARLTAFDMKPGEYELNFIYYGRNGVRVEQREPRLAHEIGMVIEAIAPTQELANMALSLARSSFLHGYFNGRKATAGNLAFPFSPSDLVGGPVYEFTIYHVMQVDDPAALFPVNLTNIG